MTRRALVLVNPHSRRGAESADRVHQALAAAGMRIVTPEPDVRAADAIRRHADGIDLVVVGGGDGSINAAVPALLGGALSQGGISQREISQNGGSQRGVSQRGVSQDEISRRGMFHGESSQRGIPLGVIPLGTANDFARTLGIPLDLDEAVRVIVAGHGKDVDVGEANGHLFLNVASVGLGVDLTRALTRDSKRRWGALGYAVAGLRVLRRLRPFTAHIEHGGQTQASRTVHVAVGNGRHYGGGMVVDVRARLDDAQLHAFSLEVDHWWQLMRLLPALRNGTHARWSEVRTMAGEELTIRTRRRRSVNTDGEITTETPVTIRVRPGALRVLVPRPQP